MQDGEQGGRALLRCGQQADHGQGDAEGGVDHRGGPVQAACRARPRGDRGRGELGLHTVGGFACGAGVVAVEGSVVTVHGW